MPALDSPLEFVYGLAAGVSTRVITRGLSELLANTPPSPDILTRLYWRGLLSRENLISGMLMHGIGHPTNTTSGDPGWMARRWEAWMDHSFPLPSIRELIAARARGIIPDDASLDNLIDLHGYDREREGLSALCSRIVRVMPDPLTINDIQQLRNWELYDDNDARRELTAAGHLQRRQQWELLQLRYEVPGPSDLVRFTVRHVFEPDLLRHFGYNDEYRPILDMYHHAHGMDYPIFTGPLGVLIDKQSVRTGKNKEQLAAEYTEKGIPEPTWAHAYWWSHWVMPSPTQGYQMLQRLRPNRLHLYRDDVPGVRTFTQDDLTALMRANDYPPYFRDALTAIAYRPMGRIDIRRAYALGVIDRTEVYERNRDLGYDPVTARVLTDYTTQESEDPLRKAARRRLAKAILDTYSMGGMTRAEAADRIDRALGRAGVGGPAVFARHAEDRARRLRESVTAVRRCWSRGELDAETARHALLRVGIIEDRARETIAHWEVVRCGRGRHVTVGQLTRYYREGGLTDGDYLGRLNRLGYEPSEARILLGLAQEDRALAGARAEARTARGVTQALAAEEKELKLILQRAREIGKNLAGYGTVEKWASHVVKGVLGGTEYYRRTRAIGIDGPRAHEYLLAAAARRPRGEVPIPAPPAEGGLEAESSTEPD